MSKLLEHLEIIEDWANEHHDSKKVWEHSIPIQEALQRLEAIDNTKPSEALEYLEGIVYVADVLKVNHKIGSRDCANQEIKEMVDRINYRIPTIKQALIKAQEMEKELADVEMVKSGKTIIHIGKDLVMMNKAKYKEYVELENEPVSKRILQAKCEEQEKALEIIFKKTVGIFQLKCCKNVDEYNDLKFSEFEKLTPEEFDLLKRY